MKNCSHLAGAIFQTDLQEHLGLTTLLKGGLRHCISVLGVSLQTLVRFRAVLQLAMIGNPTGRYTIDRASLGFCRGMQSL